MNDPAIRKAEKLRIIMAMPEYAETIGAWIKDLQLDAEHQLKNCKDPNDFRFAQGSCSAMDQLSDRFKLVFDAERSTIEKNNRKENRKNGPNAIAN